MHRRASFITPLMKRRYARIASQQSPRQQLPYFCRDTLLSRGELAFFRALRIAIAGRYLLAVKVRAADVMNCSKANWEDGYGHYIARHHLDFVICDHGTTRILAAIELDDKSHAANRRKTRDAFINEALAAAAIPLIRFRAQHRYDPQTIATLVDQHLSEITDRIQPHARGDALSKSSSGR